MLELPKDLTKISSPFIAFCGDSNLSSFIADRFFRDGSTHYNIEFLNNQDEKNMIQKTDKQKTNVEYIMKGSWYEKHSQKYPALCLFCISVDLTKFTQDRSSWLQSVKEQFSEIVNYCNTSEGKLEYDGSSEKCINDCSRFTTDGNSKYIQEKYIVTNPSIALAIITDKTIIGILSLVWHETFEKCGLSLLSFSKQILLKQKSRIIV